jgi:hypothetical protein
MESERKFRRSKRANNLVDDLLYMTNGQPEAKNDSWLYSLVRSTWNGVPSQNLFLAISALDHFGVDKVAIMKLLIYCIFCLVRISQPARDKKPEELTFC